MVHIAYGKRKPEKVYESYSVDTSVPQGRMTVAGGGLKGTKAIFSRILIFELFIYLFIYS